MTRLRTTSLIVAAHEVYKHVWNPLVWFLVLVAALIAAFATHVSLERLAVAESQQLALVEQREQDRAKNGGRLFGNQPETSLRVIRPPEPMSVLAAGVDGMIPQFWDFSPSGVRTGPAPRDAGTDRASTGANVDLEFLIRIILGLLAITLAVDSIAGERASGALLALLGQSVQPRQILVGKLLGGAATLGTATAVVGVVSLIATALGDRSLVSWGHLASLVAVCLAGVVYAFMCFAGGVLISIVFSSYRLELTATFVVWIVCALIAQPAAVVIAESVVPVRPRSVVEAERERLVQSGTLDVQNRMGNEYAALLGGPEAWIKHTGDTPTTRAAKVRAEPLWREYAAGMRSRLDAMSAARDAAMRQQRQMIRWLSLLNPAAEFSAVATSLAGTGSRMAQRWDSSVAGQQALLDRRLFDDRPGVYALTPWRDAREPGRERRATVALERKTPPTVGELSAFELPRRDFGQRLRDASPHMLALVMYVFALVAASAAAFDRLRF
jgi:ABC-type transport system involved in multi-copper enzyme maturation permease subunit